MDYTDCHLSQVELTAAVLIIGLVALALIFGPPFLVWALVS